MSSLLLTQGFNLDLYNHLSPFSLPSLLGDAIEKDENKMCVIEKCTSQSSFDN